MGSYYTSCEHCGEELSGRWDVDEDDPDQVEPKCVTRDREEHRANPPRACLNAQELVRLRAQVPVLVSLLCRLEWTPEDVWSEPECAFCYEKPYSGHESGCDLDAALTAAGLGPKERDAVRAGPSEPSNPAGDRSPRRP